MYIHEKLHNWPYHDDMLCLIALLHVVRFLWYQIDYMSIHFQKHVHFVIVELVELNFCQGFAISDI